MTRTQTFRRFAALVALALVLFAGSGITATPAAATRVGPVFDSLSAGCKVLQDRMDEIVAEFKGEWDMYQSVTPHMQDLLNELGGIAGGAWIQIGCQAVFGYYSPARALLTGTHPAYANIANVAVGAPEPTQTGHQFPTSGIGAKPLARR